MNNTPPKGLTGAALIAWYETENKRLAELAAKATGPRALKFKIGDKGGMSVYGLGRFPVTLYKEQWFTLLDKAEEIKTFLNANDAQLKAKGDAVAIAKAA